MMEALHSPDALAMGCMTKSLHRPKLAALPAAEESTWRLPETSQGRSSHRLDDNMLSMSPLAKKEDSNENKGHAGATNLASAQDSVVRLEKEQQLFDLDTQREATELLDCSTSSILNCCCQQHPRSQSKKLTVGCH